MNWLEHYLPQRDASVVFCARPGGGGLGDRVMGLVSTAVLALLLQRTFRVDWREPLPLRAVWRSARPELAWDRPDWSDGAFDHLALIDQAECARPMWRTADLAHLAPPCLRIEANQHYFSDLLQNPFLRRQSAAYQFPDPATLTGQLLGELFAPTDELAAVLMPYLKRMDGRRWLGLQIRTLWHWQDGGGALDETGLERLLGCTQQLLAEGRAEGLFVTADDEGVVRLAQRRLSHVPVLAVDGPIAHLDRSCRALPRQHLDTFVNLHLLAACQELVISHWSNFGRLAALWYGRPTYVTRKSGGSALLDVPGDWRPAAPEELLSKEHALQETG
jgi:hypothetical protein